jgi:hypothetical protein
MPYIITHHDADGVLCAATLMKAYRKKFWVYFTSPNRLLSAICNAVLDSNGNDELYICDICGNRKSIHCAGAFDRVVWLDHHVWEKLQVPESIELVVDENAASATGVVGKYTGVNDFVQIADEIDTNAVVTETADRMRSITFAIKMLSQKPDVYRNLYGLAEGLANKGPGFVYSPAFDEMIAKYNILLTAGVNDALATKKVFDLGNLRVATLKIGENIPVAPVFNQIAPDALDIIVFVAERTDGTGTITKLEFRTQTEHDVLGAAKAFGGGGHVHASGATVYGKLDDDAIIEKIRKAYG